MLGSITFASESYSFEQFGNLKDLSSDLKYIEVCRDFVQDWISDKNEFLQQTSGSTGTPQEILLTRDQMISSAKSTCEVLGLKPGDRALLCISAEYIGGKMMLVRAMEIGMNIVLIPPNSIEQQMNLIKGPFQFAAMVPLQVSSLLETLQGNKTLASIDKIIIGGGEVSADLEAKLLGFSNVFYNTYGMTETASHIALKTLNGPNRSGLFAPMSGVNLTLDHRGCLCIRGQVTNNELLATNDLVDLREDGTFEWLGRFDNVINSGGIKIRIEELEKQITRLLPNCNFLISSRPDEKYGEIVVLLSEGHIDENSKALIRNSVEKYHAPKMYVEIEALPLTASGKPDRKEARRLASLSA